MVLNNDLWGQPPEKEGESKTQKSKALPFAPRPKLLDGTLAGDVGFEYVSSFCCSCLPELTNLAVPLALLGPTKPV